MILTHLFLLQNSVPLQKEWLQLKVGNESGSAVAYTCQDTGQGTTGIAKRLANEGFLLGHMKASS